MDPTSVSSGKNIQEVMIADATSSAKCTLWESSIGSLELDKCYHLKHFSVQEFNSIKYLSIQKQGSEILPIQEEMDDIASSNDKNNDDEVILNSAIIGVSKLDSYKVCMRCKVHVEPSDDTTGRCSKEDCMMLQRYDIICKQQLTAKLLFTSTKNEFLSLFAYNKTLLEMTKVNNSEKFYLDYQCFLL